MSVDTSLISANTVETILAENAITTEIEVVDGIEVAVQVVHLLTPIVDISRSLVSLVNTGLLGPQGIPGPQGEQGPPGLADLHYDHDQMSASAYWVIDHNLGKYPSVSVIDSAGACCEGFVEYITSNRVTITFSAAFAGHAYLN